MATTVNQNIPTTIPSVAFRLMEMLKAKRSLTQSDGYTIYKQLLRVIRDDNNCSAPTWSFDDYIKMLKVSSIDDKLVERLHFFNPPKSKAKPKVKINATKVTKKTTAPTRLDNLETRVDCLDSKLDAILSILTS